MGRTRLDLVPFLRKGLEESLYTTLFYVDKEMGKARLKLPRKCDRLSKSDQKILNDWDAIKGRIYNYGSSYSKARQRFRQAIKKSIFLKTVISKDNLDFSFRTASEISESKRKRNDGFSEAALSPVESLSSGYVSGPEEMEIDADGECYQRCKTFTILESIKHDHNFGYDKWMNFPGKVEEKLPDNIFEDSEEPVFCSGNYDEGIQVPEMILEDSETCAGPDTAEEIPKNEVENYLNRNDSFDQNNLNDLKEEMYNLYVRKPLSSHVVDQKQHSATDISSFESKSLKEDLFLKIGTSALMKSILPSQMDYFSVEKNNEMVKVEGPPEAVRMKGSFRACECIQVIKTDVLIQLIFEEKVYEVNSPPSGEDNFLDYGNLKVIIDQKLKEELEGYRPFYHAVIGSGRNLTIYFKPKC